MRIAIIVQAGPSAGRRIVLRGGQTARFGRSDWADFAFTDDSGMADIHFAIHCGINSAMFQSIATDRETLLNGTAIEKCIVSNGDVVQASNTQFLLQIDDSAMTDSHTPQERAVSSSEITEPETETVDIAEYIGLSDDAKLLAKNATTPMLFGQVLRDAALLKDAIRWHAHTMPKPKAVLWGGRCVSPSMNLERDPLQIAAFRAAMDWANRPEEANREKAMLLAEQSSYEGIGGLMAAAAGWSGGSLGPADQPDVPPDDRLTARTLCAVLAIADGLGNPLQSRQRLVGYIECIANPLSSSAQA